MTSYPSFFLFIHKTTYTQFGIFQSTTVITQKCLCTFYISSRSTGSVNQWQAFLCALLRRMSCKQKRQEACAWGRSVV